MSPGPGASPRTPAAPSFLAPSPAELNPAGGWAWVCTAGDLRHSGEPIAGNSCVALEGLGVMGEKHGCRAGAMTSGPALTPAWSGVIPTCLLCLMGRPSHNSGGYAGAGTSSGLLHRNRVTGGGDVYTPSSLHSLVCGLTLLFLLSGPVVTISGGPVGGAPPVPHSLWGFHSTRLPPLPSGLRRGCGGCDCWPGGRGRPGCPGWGLRGPWPREVLHWSSQPLPEPPVGGSPLPIRLSVGRVGSVCE